MRDWSSAVPLLTIVFASGYILGRNLPSIPQFAAHKAGSSVAERASPAWHTPRPGEPMPRGRLVMPDFAQRDLPPVLRLPPGDLAVPADGLADPGDQVSRDGIERDLVVAHPREPIRT
jgi:hypothetical protein